MPFVARLQHLRTYKGLSQLDLANLTGLKLTYISQLEAGTKIPSCETLESLAEALDVPICELFYDNQEPPQTPWLTPRPALEELLAGPNKIQPETGLVRTVKLLRDELSALLH